MQPEKHPVTNNHALVADLYRSYAPALLMYICRKVPSREDAEDILLEVFQAAVESDILATLNDGERRAWLRKVAHNKAIDHYRRAYRGPIFDPMRQEVEETLYEDDFDAPESFV